MFFFQLSLQGSFLSTNSCRAFQADICLCVCVRMQVCTCGVQHEKEWSERHNSKGTGRKRDRGVNYLNAITALTTSIHHLHPPSATARSPHPGPAFPPSRPDALSSQTGPSLHRVKMGRGALNNLSSSVCPPSPLFFFAQARLDLDPLRLEVSCPLPHLSGAPQERWIKIQARQADPLSK